MPQDNTGMFSRAHVSVSILSFRTSSHYSWDPLENVCWYTNANHQQRLAWQIGTQIFWTVLTVLGEVVTACIVTTYMLRARVRLSDEMHAQRYSALIHSIVKIIFFRLQHYQGQSGRLGLIGKRLDYCPTRVSCRRKG